MSQKSEGTTRNANSAMGAIRTLERGVENLLFAARWVLAPVYLGLAVSLFAICYKFLAKLVELINSVVSDDLHLFTMQLLGLLDIALIGNLILIIMFSGYDNFVSRIEVAESSKDRPTWMGKVDYSGLKIKLIGSLVAISVIDLLKDFIEAENLNFQTERWRVTIHFAFVISGVLFALMDYLTGKRQALDMDAEVKHLEIRRLAAEFEQFKKSLAEE